MEAGVTSVHASSWITTNGSSEKGLGTICRSKAPLRISFTGGGTDFPHWFDAQPGAVLCCTINRYAYATLYPREDQEVHLHSVDLGRTIQYTLKDTPMYDGVLDLAKAAIFHLAPRQGMSLDVRCDAPPGSGLGGSSAVTAAVLGAVAASGGRNLDQYEFAELNYFVERQDLKIAGGKQDQFATTFGGFNVIEFHRDRVVVNPLRIDASIVNDLEAHLILCYTGRARTDLGLIDQQIRLYGERLSTREGMQRLYELVFEMKEALLKRRLNTFGELLHEAYVNKKRMNPDVATGTIADELYERAREAGAIGGKLMGAGGGGYLLVYCETGRRQAVTQALTSAGGLVTDFNFDLAGLQTWRSRCP